MPLPSSSASFGLPMKPSQLTSEGHLGDYECITRFFLANQAWIPDKIGRQARIRIHDDLVPAAGNLCRSRIERPDDMSSMSQEGSYRSYLLTRP